VATNELPELVRELNARIRELGARLAGTGDDSLDYFCECGCWETVQLTTAAYDALDGRPIYSAGHTAPVEAQAAG